MHHLKCTFIQFMTVLICAQIVVGSITHADEVAKDILERAQLSMSPPIRAVIDSNGIEATIHQKLLASGLVATRTDLGPPVSMTILELGDERYEVYSHGKTVIDMRFQQIMNRQQVMELRERETVLGTISPGIAREFTLDVDVKFNGRECWQLSRTMSKERLELLQSVMPIMTNDKTPTETRYFVDKASFEVAGVELYSANGQRILLSKYMSLTHPDDLQDEFFCIPDKFLLLKPTSLDEYVSLKVDLKTSELRMRTKELNNRLQQVNHRRALEDRADELLSTTHSVNFYLKQLMYTLLFVGFVAWAVRRGLIFAQKGKGVA